MKKLLTASILGLSILAGASFADAQTTTTTTTVTTRRVNQTGRFQRPRVVTRTRIVRVGFRTYRETIQTRYFANGRTTTRVISRVRVR